MRNQRSFRTKSRLKVVDNSVKVSQVIGKKDSNGQPFYPSFTNLTVVLVTEDKRTYETTKATADGLGNITFLKRGLADDGTDTEVAKFKRAWMPGTLMFVTFGSEDYDSKADVSSVPTKTSDLLNDSGFIDSCGLACYAQCSDLGCAAFTNDYGDLCNLPTIPAAQIQSDWNQCDCTQLDYIQNKPTIPTNTSDLCNDSGFIDCTYHDCTKQDTLTAGCNITICGSTISAEALSDCTRYGASLDLTMDACTYVLQTQLKDQCGCSLGSACCIDLPLESVVVCGCYDCACKEVELDLEGGSCIRFSVADLVSGLQSEITCSNKLCADFVDDSSSTNKFVTASDLTNLGNLSGTNTGDQCACDFDIKDLADTCCCRDVWNAKLGGGDNVSCLVNDAGYLTCSTLPGLNTQVVKIEISTPNGTAQKTATLTGYTPTTGDLILAHFKYGNSANNVSLNINNTGNKYIRLGGTIANANNFSIPNQTDMYAFLMYNGHSYNAYATDNTTYTASSFDIKNLADSSSCRTAWNNKLGTGSNVSCLCNDAGYLTSSDLSGYQTTANMVCDLTSADDDHYPSAKAVYDALQGAGSGDMQKCVYDPNNCSGDAFDYCNMFNTPTIPTDNCQLANSCGFTTCTGTLQACDIANLAQCCDIPTNNNQLSNGCGYTTCTGTLVASDLNGYAKSCDLKTVATSGKYCDLTGTPTLCTVATSGKYCDLSGTPTIPTDNCQLANGCGFTTCTGTLTSSDISGLVAESCIACINGCCLTNGGDICVGGGGGGTVMCECCYDPGDYQQDFLYFTY